MFWGAEHRVKGWRKRRFARVKGCQELGSVDLGSEVTVVWWVRGVAAHAVLRKSSTIGGVPCRRYELNAVGLTPGELVSIGEGGGRLTLLRMAVVASGSACFALSISSRRKCGARFLRRPRPLLEGEVARALGSGAVSGGRLADLVGTCL
jgi:hypothetical protein